MLKEDVFLNVLLAGTTVDMPRVYAFFYEEPKKATIVFLKGTFRADDDLKYFDTILRMYLRNKALPDVLIEHVSLFLKFGPPDASLILREYLERLEQYLLGEQWYELIGRFKPIRQVIRRMFRI
ncbi:hypothetical protein [Spirosoma koreense]